MTVRGCELTIDRLFCQMCQVWVTTQGPSICRSDLFGQKQSVSIHTGALMAFLLVFEFAQVLHKVLADEDEI